MTICNISSITAWYFFLKERLALKVKLLIITRWDLTSHFRKILKWLGTCTVDMVEPGTSQWHASNPSVGIFWLAVQAKLSSSLYSMGIYMFLLSSLHSNDLSWFQRPLKNDSEVSQWCQPTLGVPCDKSHRHHRLTCIQLEQQIPCKFEVGWEFIVTTVTVVKPNALVVPEPVISAENKGKEGIKHLCFFGIPTGEVTSIIK